MKKTSLFLAGIVAASGFTLLTKAGEAQQSRNRTPQQSQLGNPARQQKITQLKKEAEQAEQDYRRQQQEVRKREAFEKPVEYIKKGADFGVGIVGGKVGRVGKGVEYIYKDVTNSILDPQGAERRSKLMEESRARLEQEKLRKQQWEQDILRRQEEFNRRLRVPNFTER